MLQDKRLIVFDCPWCGKSISREVYRTAETEIICSECKKLIGVVTDVGGKPIVIATKVHKFAPAEPIGTDKLDKTEANIEKARFTARQLK